MSSKKGSARGRTNSTSSKGNRPSSSSNFAPSPMSVDQYAMHLGFTTLTQSKSRSSGIRIGSPTESLTPPRPLANLIRPSGKVVQMRFPTSPLSNRESSTPPTTYSQAVTPDKRFVPRLEIKSYFQKPTVVYDPIIEPGYQTSSSIQEDEEQVDPEYDLDDSFLDSQPMCAPNQKTCFKRKIGAHAAHGCRSRRLDWVLTRAARMLAQVHTNSSGARAGARGSDFACVARTSRLTNRWRIGLMVDAVGKTTSLAIIIAWRTTWWKTPEYDEGDATNAKQNQRRFSDAV
ncbi:hypothetical protein E6C27_scaffold1248G00100 [Cucumis melo var. makuwa]|uniref:Uncharacterized protein n=1 Tax=Cucumis melo var. makuwa TaxID=1194695 RepID=A0A5A7UFZ9_CUCMM|nr:hypothetical protein E6C27_scaffold1248G00100 [Cucumis melo var. makuwa]